MSFYGFISPEWGSLQAAIVKQATEDYTQALRGKDIHNGFCVVPPEETKKEIKYFIENSVYTSGVVNFKDFEKACKNRAKYYTWREHHKCVKCKIFTCPLYNTDSMDYTHEIVYQCLKGGNDGKVNKGTNKTCK